MKKCIASILLFILFMPPLISSADVLIEPENDFYARHSRNIIYLGRSFIANSTGSYVSVMEAPDSRREVAKLQNGEVIYLQFSCLYDNQFWGYTFNPGGWIKIDELLAVYDYVAFEKEHLSEFYRYEGDYGEINDTRSALVWAFPGAEAPLWTLTDINTEHFWVSHAYMDENGNEWGFIPYMYGSRNIWVCLNAPLNRDIPAFKASPEPMPWDSATTHTNIPKTSDSMVAVIIVLVAGLVMGTGVLIRVLWKPDKLGTMGGKDDD
jgi:hypothetical protein